jgi:hypothetical protein
MIDKNLREIAAEFLNYPLRNNHKKFIQNNYFAFPDNRDFYVIKFFCNVTKASSTRLFAVCKCGQPNTPGHAEDECKITLGQDERNCYLEQFKKIYKNTAYKYETLHDYLYTSYYSATSEDGLSKSDISQMVKLVKTIIVKVVLERAKEEKGDQD